MHSESDNIKFLMNDKADEIIELTIGKELTRIDKNGEEITKKYMLHITTD